MKDMLKSPKRAQVHRTNSGPAAAALQRSIDLHRQQVEANRPTLVQIRACEVVRLAKRYGTLLLLLFTCTLNAQEPTPFLEPSELVSLDCTTLLDMGDDVTPYGSILNEEWTTVGIDTFVGFWQFQRFFVPSKGIVLSFYDCGVTYDLVPYFGERPITEQSRPLVNFFTWKSQSTSQWARHIGYIVAGVSGYCGGQAEHLRFANGLPTHNGDAYHLNRDLGLWGMGGTGIALSTSWFKDPNMKWWKIPVDLGASFFAYQIGKELGYHGN